MSEINVHLAESEAILDSGEYLGFFGDDGFGDPIPLNEFNGRTFITDSTGSTQEEECDNCKLTTQGSFSGVGGVSGVIIGQTGSGISLISLPNYLATMNIRFTHTEEVIIQNAQLVAFDGSTLAEAPVGVRVYAAEVIHTNTIQDDDGIGDDVWFLLEGSGTPLALVDSPGTSGFSPAGPASLDTRHDWYVAMSVSPFTPNDKTFGFRVDCEFV